MCDFEKEGKVASTRRGRSVMDSYVGLSGPKCLFFGAQGDIRLTLLLFMLCFGTYWCPLFSAFLFFLFLVTCSFQSSYMRCVYKRCVLLGW